MTFLRRFGFLALLLVFVTSLTSCNKNPVINIPGPAPLRLIVADINNNQLLALTQPLGPSSIPSTTLTGATGGFSSAHHIDANAQGAVFMADPAADSVVVFTSPITSTSHANITIGPITGGIFPNAVTIDAAGNAWVTDGNAQDVYEFTPPFSSGAQAPAFTMTSTPSMAIPVQPSFDRAGNMYVAQEGLSAFFAFTKPFSASAVPSANISTTTCTPAATAMDVTDRLFLSCTNDGTVRVFSPPYATGNVQSFTIASVGGATNAATLRFDSAGNLYVAYVGVGIIGVFSPPFSSSSVPLFTLSMGLGGPFGIAFAP